MGTELQAEKDPTLRGQVASSVSVLNQFMQIREFIKQDWLYIDILGIFNVTFLL